MSTKMVILEPRELRRSAWEGVVDSPGSAVSAFHMMHDDDTWSLLRVLNSATAMHFAAHHITSIASTAHLQRLRGRRHLPGIMKRRATA